MTDTTLPELLRVGNEPDFEAPPPVDDEDDFVLPPSRGKLPRATLVLGALVILAVGVLGGVEVQKHEGTSTTAGGFAARAGRARGTGAAGAGGLEGFGAAGAGGFGAAGGTGTSGGAGGATGAAGGTTGTATTTPAVAPIAIGTVVSLKGSTLVVKDLGGNTRTITLGSGVTLTTSAPLTATSLKAGDTVTVSGTTAANGTSTATTVLRRTSN